jgi:hypothetical protein
MWGVLVGSPSVQVSVLGGGGVQQHKQHFTVDIS